MSVGNHEVWADPKIEGVLSAVPYLKKFGVTPENLITNSTSKAPASFICGAGSTITGRPHNGTVIGQNMPSR